MNLDTAIQTTSSQQNTSNKKQEVFLSFLKLSEQQKCSLFSFQCRCQ